MSTEERVTTPFPSSFDRDLENARVLIEDSPWKENPQKYRKVAEAILRRILRFDPANESAKLLLEKAVEIPVPVAVPESSVPRKTVETVLQPRQELSPAPPAPVPPPGPVPPAPAPAPSARMDVPVVQAPPPHRPVSEPNFTFIIDGRSSVRKESTRRPPWVLVTLAALPYPMPHDPCPRSRRARRCFASNSQAPVCPPVRAEFPGNQCALRFLRGFCSASLG